MTSEHFFEESREQSRVKTAIVAKYFSAWARVIMSAQNRHGVEAKIAYIDLFCGPGRYEDGTRSTPILVLERAIADSDLRNRLVTIFNDRNECFTDSLRSAIAELPGVGTLRYPPIVHTGEVGEDFVQWFEGEHLVPTLFFVDPWGYRGLSLRLVNSVVKDWGCDCVFFFNYNRINMGLGNPIVKQHMDSLFGQPTADELRAVLEPLSAADRELTIVEALCDALKSPDSRYVLPFRFRNDAGRRTSHHLIFVSKHFKGYEIMKDIMARESSSRQQGVASFEYSPSDARQPLLFQLSRPLDDLVDQLLEDFAGQSLTMRELYERHSVGRPFTKSNYKDTLLVLEGQARIHATKHRKNSFADSVEVTFP